MPAGAASFPFWAPFWIPALAAPAVFERGGACVSALFPVPYLAGLADAVVYAHDASFAGAVRATEKLPARLHPMTNNSAIAVSAMRRQRVNGAFKAIKIVGDVIDHDFQQFVVFISANFASNHNFSFQHCDSAALRPPSLPSAIIIGCG